MAPRGLLVIIWSPSLDDESLDDELLDDELLEDELLEDELLEDSERVKLPGVCTSWS